MLGEVAIRRVVDKGVMKLSENDVKSIVVIGGIGNMMSSTARYIMKTFAMRMEWTCAQYQFPEKPTTVEEKTIILVNGLGCGMTTYASGVKQRKFVNILQKF